MAEPMITIKKPDGTFAKVSLSEFKKIQADKKQAQVQKTTPVASPASASVMGKTTVHIKSDDSSVRSMQPEKKLNRDDARSPLEEKIQVKSMAPLTSAKREKQVDEVLQKIGFNVAPDLVGRLKSLVLARLKDIKTEEEIKETLSRPVKSGGLGLNNNQVDAVVRCSREVLHIETGVPSALKHNEVPVLKGKNNMALMVEPPELPMVIPDLPLVKSAQEVLPSSARVSDFKTKTTTPAAVPQSAPIKKPASNDIVAKLINESMANEPIFKISNNQPLKQSMHDISAPAEVEMGPVEEFKSVSLEEFRRLSSNPVEAAKRLHQKMSNLQEESFVWYLDGIHAYHQSPLYREYMNAVTQSLVERKTLANVLNAKNGIKLTEVMALIEMEEDL